MSHTSIDLDTIHNTKFDLSTAEGRLAHLGDASKAAPGSNLHKANKWARNAKEVLSKEKYLVIRLIMEIMLKKLHVKDNVQ